MNRLAAMHDRDIRIQWVDCDDMTVTFANGVTLPIIGFLAPDKYTLVDDAVEGGYAEFGNDEFGYGYYPVRLIGDEEYEQELKEFEHALQER